VANDRAARRPLGDPSRDRATAGADRALVDAVRRALRAAADPARAPGMQAYMKSAMPYHGVPAPAQRRTFRRVFADHPLGSAAAWRATVLALWREAGHREERYAAIALASDGRYRAERTSLEALALFEELIVTGAWWDLVDGVATHLVAGLLAGHRAPMTATLLAWSRSPDRWLRRTAIISQVHARPAPTGSCCTPASNPTSPTETSSSARRSAGRCAPTPGPTLTRSPATFAPTSDGCRASAAARR
jgi:3-methyladenine DNA glycosylase AlkD